MFKFLLVFTLVCILIAFIAEYWLWIILILLISIALFLLGVKMGYIKPFEIKQSAKAKNIESRTLKEEIFHAVGVSYYESNIHKLSCNNPDWKLTASQIINSEKVGKRIFKYYYINRPVKLQMDSENPHDKNAVSIIIAGELVGYISREENVHVRDILQNYEVISISGFIGGGEYKIVVEDGQVIQDENGLSVNVRIKYL